MAAAVHVLVFPWPQQGHINCMLHFATALAGAGVHVTFLHNDHNLRRLTSASAAALLYLRFLSVSDGLPDAHPRAVGNAVELAMSLMATNTATGAYRSLLASLSGGFPRPSRAVDADVAFPPVTCVVADGLLTWAINIAEDLGIPALAFRTASACSFLAYLSVPNLFELGELPFPANSDLDALVRGVPGMESFLRRRDLPSPFRRSRDDPVLKLLTEYTAHSRKARALVLNTAACLERSALEHIAPHMRDVFAIGPLHATAPSPSAASSLWHEDDGCMAWLDAQADRSVVYVSLGSLAVITLDQFTEFLSGLANTGYPFIWVLRPDMVVGAGRDVALVEATTHPALGKGKARMVSWAPQRDVLRHRAVGCFLMHCGWNSTLEGIVEGMPMLCWPFFTDQQINSRFVGAVWRNGLDMKDVCDRAVIERLVREVMESAEIRAAAQALAQQVKRDVGVGGCSSTEFKRLVGFIKDLSVAPLGKVSEH